MGFILAWVGYKQIDNNDDDYSTGMTKMMVMVMVMVMMVIIG